MFKVRESQSFKNMMASTGQFFVVAGVMAGCHMTSIHVLIYSGNLRGESGILCLIELPNVILNSMH